MGKCVSNTFINYFVNLQILTQILKQSSAPLKDARLVCKFWNEMVLSLPNTRLGLKINNRYTRPMDPTSFSKLCLSLQKDSKSATNRKVGRLAKKTSAICDTKKVKGKHNLPRATLITSFVVRLTNFCEIFDETVQIMKLSIDDQKCLKCIHQILGNRCPNLKQLQIFCKFTHLKEILFEPLPPKPYLKSFVLNSTLKTPIQTLTSFIQIVLNASSNLKVTIPWGSYPDLENSKFLDSLTIAQDYQQTHYVALFKLEDMSRMLLQVSYQLVSLCVGEKDDIEFVTDFGPWSRPIFQLPVKMPKLEKYRNVLVDVFQCVDVLQDFEMMPALKTLVIGKATTSKSANLNSFFRPIFKKKRQGKIFRSVTNLKILEMHDPRLSTGLKTTFPNLMRLQVDTSGSRGKESRMKLGVVLKACGGCGRLKHLELALPICPQESKDVIPALLQGNELYKGQSQFSS